MSAWVIGLTLGSAIAMGATSYARADHVGHNPIVLAAGDCGRDYHRDEHGKCVADWREMEGRECPRGYHIGPDRKRCWPN